MTIAKQGGGSFQFGSVQGQIDYRPINRGAVEVMDDIRASPDITVDVLP